LVAGDFLTVYDLGDLLGAAPTASYPITSAPAGLTASTAFLGVTPAGVNPTDDPTRLNITFTYEGTPLLTDTTFTVTFSTAVPIAGTTAGQFTSTDTLVATGGKINQSGAVTIPVSVPEPTSVVLLGIGLGSLALICRKVKT